MLYQTESGPGEGLPSMQYLPKDSHTRRFDMAKTRKATMGMLFSGNRRNKFADLILGGAIPVHRLTGSAQSAMILVQGRPWNFCQS